MIWQATGAALCSTFVARVGDISAISTSETDTRISLDVWLIGGNLIELLYRDRESRDADLARLREMFELTDMINDSALTGADAQAEGDET